MTPRRTRVALALGALFVVGAAVTAALWLRTRPVGQAPAAPRTLPAATSLPPSAPAGDGEDPGGIEQDTSSAETGRLSGKVERPDGSPASGAEVVIAGSGVWPPRRIEAGGDGSFRIDALPEGVYELRAQLGVEVSSPLEGIAIEPSQHVEVRLALAQGRTLTGKVVDAQTGSALPGAVVDALEDALSATPRQAVANASGEFRVEGLRALPHRVTASAPGYVSSEDTRVPGPGKGEIGLLRGCVLTGSVLDEAGAPVADAQLEVTGKNSLGQPVQLSGLSVAGPKALAAPQAPNTPAAGDNLGVTVGTVPRIPLIGPPEAAVAGSSALVPVPELAGFRSDDKGAFRLEGVPPGELRVIAHKPGFVRGVSTSLRLHPGAALAEVVVTLSRGGTVMGSVASGDGAPIVHVRVEASCPAEGIRGSLSDAAGAFRFDALRGACTVTAYPLGLPPAQASVEVRAAAEHEVTLVVEQQTHALHGRVRDPRGEPLEHATVSVRSSRGGSPVALTVLTAEDGTFEAAGLPAPPYSVSADHAELAPSPALAVVAADAPIEIRLTAGAELTGSVVRAETEEPVAGATVRLKAPDGSALTTRSKAEGSFELVHASAGRYELFVDATGFMPEQRAVTLDERRPLHERFVLARAGAVRGEVVDRRGVPVWNAEVGVGSPPDYAQGSRSDHSGRFLLRAVRPGEVTVRARHATAGEAAGGAPARVLPGEEANGVLVRLPGYADEPSEAPATTAPRLELTVRAGATVVTKVPDDSAAAAAGVRAGDVLLSLDGEPILSPAQARAMIDAPLPGRHALAIRRAGRAHVLRLKAAAASTDRE